MVVQHVETAGNTLHANTDNNLHLAEFLQPTLAKHEPIISAVADCDISVLVLTQPVPVHDTDQLHQLSSMSFHTLSVVFESCR